ncbi:MAG: peptidoglycan-binding domain-containing protein [Herbinix sp.]|nr:peptidoglycan-binding domain-containing protein [Herbinix sp.]
MKDKYVIRLAAICMATIMALAPVNAYAATLLKVGSRGTEVTKVQSSLQTLGYYTYPKTTGYYGSVTKEAVKRFQRANGISADGIVGKKTMGILIGNTPVKAVTGSVIKVASFSTSTEYSGALDWFTQVKDIWKRGMNAVVTDVDTGKSFQVKRTYGTNHADVEPLTTADTKTIKEIWGGFGWERRAVVVQISQYTLAGSMTAMPHAGLDNKPEGAYVSRRSGGYGWGTNLDTVKNNGIDGHMDIHFKNSRTHSTNVVQKVHQDMVKKAANYIATMNLSQLS